MAGELKDEAETAASRCNEALHEIIGAYEQREAIAHRAGNVYGAVRYGRRRRELVFGARRTARSRAGGSQDTDSRGWSVEEGRVAVLRVVAVMDVVDGRAASFAEGVGALVGGAQLLPSGRVVAVRAACFQASQVPGRRWSSARRRRWSSFALATHLPTRMTPTVRTSVSPPRTLR